MVSSKQPHLLIMFWDWGIGGIQTRMTDLIVYLSKKGSIRVTLLLRKKIINERELPVQSEDFTVYYCPDALNKRRWFFFFWLVYKVVSKKPTHILTLLNRFHFIGIISKWILSINGISPKIILNQPILTSKYIQQFEQQYWNQIVSYTYQKSDRIIVQTNAVANDLVRNYGIKNNLIVIVKNWVNTKKNISLKKKYDITFIGRLSQEKRVDIFLQTVLILEKTFPNIRACIVGSGDQVQYVHSFIAKHHLQKNIEFVGYQSITLPFIQASKIICLPSENEGMPMSILEAMSCSVPCIISNFPGSDELLTHGKNGFICSKNKEYALYATQLLSDQKVWNKISQSAYQHVKENFSEDNLKQFYSQLFISN